MGGHACLGVYVHGEEVVAGVQATLARSLIKKKKILEGEAREGERGRAAALFLSLLLLYWYRTLLPALSPFQVSLSAS